MKILSLLMLSLLVIATSAQSVWISEKQSGYTLHYTQMDRGETAAYASMVQQGMASVTGFFKSPFKKSFDVYIHPNRHSLDSTWQHDWAMPDFKSECWMVASGVAARLDVISPRQWNIQACEHRYEDEEKTQQLITHELVHVYHGQHNISPDFSNVEGLDWFVEGLATYASGQCDGARLAEVKKAVISQIVPTSLDQFWTGRLRYGLSGSIVKYLDEHYGRAALIGLLGFNKKGDVLAKLQITEAELLKGWKEFIIIK